MLFQCCFGISHLFNSFWLGLPFAIFGDLTLLAMDGMFIPILIAHVGTMLNIKELIQQRHTVVIVLST
ncbi:hypothetical protein [Fundicoccus ignavus]|uniref:hypothetical protein n=1 Tax=Fundicoccus ignavus TaxID=2664442 RepID=UPI001562E516|nr:hypothetical protein [Fundicoccus ignavus]